MAQDDFTTSYQIRLSAFSFDSGSADEGRVLSQGQILQRANALTPGRVDELAKLATEVGVRTAGEVIFDVSPKLSESRTAEYVNQGLPGPVGVVVYTITGNREFSINARFVSRTAIEAAKNYRYVNQLRAWLIPRVFDFFEAVDSGDFSQGIKGAIVKSSNTNARPPILRLSGYKKQFWDIPVVMTSLSIDYPEDCDYIETDHAMVPIIQEVSLTLIESHGLEAVGETLDEQASQDQILARLEGSSSRSEFLLEKFRIGQLRGY